MKQVTQALNDAKVEPTSTEIADAEQYYVDNAGSMETATESSHSEDVLDHLSSNFVSPVMSIEQTDGTVYYGVIDYTEGDEWYGFYAYDDRSVGRRVVGTQESDSVQYDSEVPHASAGDPTGSFGDRPDASYAELVNGFTDSNGDKVGGLKEYYGETLGESRSMLSAIERPTDTVPATRGKDSGPNSARERGRSRAQQVANENSNAGGNSSN